LDINESWFDATVPWDSDEPKVEAILLQVLSQIIENNAGVFDALRQLLTHPNFELVYVFGNHDGLLAHYPAAQAMLRQTLLQQAPEADSRLFFGESYQHAGLNLHVEHGHRLDQFNNQHAKHNPALGDVVNVLVVNGFEQRVVAKMTDHGYDPDEINEVWQQLAEIGLLRPLTLFPLWLEMVSTQTLSFPQEKESSLKQLIRESLYDIFRQHTTVRYFVEKLHVPAWMLKALAKSSLRFPIILPVLSYIISKLVRSASSNTQQYRAAQKLNEHHGYRLIVYGHTHSPTVESLDHGGYYFNTGSWMPIIRLVKKVSKKTTPLDYLALEDRFRKMYQCSILRLEKDLTKPDVPAEYFLQTLRNGQITERGSVFL